MGHLGHGVAALVGKRMEADKRSVLDTQPTLCAYSDIILEKKQEKPHGLGWVSLQCLNVDSLPRLIP
jgi:hypothetical protein